MINELGGIDILVNSAAVATRATPMEISEEEWNNIMAIDLKGCLLCTQAAGRRMIEQGRGGNIINISSVAAMNAHTNRSGYCVAKAGLLLLTRVLAKELSVHNIRVNAIIPGFTRTEMKRTEMNREVWSNPKLLKQELATVPMNRWAEPVEVANAALMLASDAASYISGTALTVDGGMTA
jgi:NAD(P)-dependent dehydrogenase (short-subunit alcohol dehydrogenase family)